MRQRIDRLLRPNPARGEKRPPLAVSWPVPLFLAFMLLFAAADVLRAHLALQSSSPGAGETLTEVPQEIVLTFTEEIDLPLSSVALSGPEGAVALDPIADSPRGTELRARIAGSLAPGGYRIEWQAVGEDGHPVRGESTFEIAAGAAGLEAPVSTSTVETEPVRPIQATPRLEVQSPQYAFIRWVNYLSIIAAIGSVAFLLVLRRAVGTGGNRLPEFTAAVSASAVRFGLLAVGVLGASLVLRLQAQSQAVLGIDISGSSLGTLFRSDWGTALVVQAVGGLLLALGISATRRAATVGLPLAVVGAFVLVGSAASSSHAAATPRLPGLAMLADGMHVLAAATWLGCLLLFVVAGVPHIRRLDQQERPRVYDALLRTFSAIALTAGGAVIVTGVLAANLQLNGPGDLFSTRYGAVLAVKLALAGAVFLLGALNWRRLRHRQHEGDVVVLFRRRAGFELAVAVLVVAATAVLVAIPPPSHEGSAATMNSFP